MLSESPSTGPVAATHCMHVQRVHTQVESCEVHALKHVHERLSPTPLHVHYLSGVLLHGSFDEAEQVLLVHARWCMDMCIHLENDHSKFIRQLML